MTHTAKIVPWTEAFSSAFYHDDPNAGIVAGMVKCADHFRDHLAGDGVSFLWTVQGNGEDAISVVDDDVLGLKVEGRCCIPGVS